MPSCWGFVLGLCLNILCSDWSALWPRIGQWPFRRATSWGFWWGTQWERLHALWSFLFLTQDMDVGGARPFVFGFCALCTVVFGSLGETLCGENNFRN